MSLITRIPAPKSTVHPITRSPDAVLIVRRESWWTVNGIEQQDESRESMRHDEFRDLLVGYRREPWQMFELPFKALFSRYVAAAA